MFDITKLALKIPNFLTHEECDGLINEFYNNPNKFTEGSKSFATNKYQASNFSVVKLVPNTESFNFVKYKTKEVVEKYLKYLEGPNCFFTDNLKNYLCFSHHYRIMEYKTGHYIHPHTDFIPFFGASVTFNLNNDYKGGKFSFFNKKYTIDLNKGDALIFPNDYFWLHEVTTVTKGTRYSVNSFIGKYPFEIIERTNWLGNLMYEDYIKEINPNELLGPYN